MRSHASNTLTVLFILILVPAIFTKGEVFKTIADKMNDGPTKQVQENANTDLFRGPVALENFHFNARAEYTDFVNSAVQSQVELLSENFGGPIAAELAIRAACEEHQAQIIGLMRNMHAGVVTECRSRGYRVVTLEFVEEYAAKVVATQESKQVWESIAASLESQLFNN